MKSLEEIQALDGSEPASEEVAGSIPKKKRESGISLLIALISIMTMVGLVADLLITSRVNMELTVSTRDQIKAEYLSKSGFNLALFLVSVSWAIDLFQSADPPLGSKKPLADDESSLWASMNELPPIGASTVDLLLATSSGVKEGDDPFHLKGVFSEKVASQMRLFEDQFSVKITDESARINVNDCSEGRCEWVIARLIALFSCPVEKAFLDSKNITGEQLAYRIKDFISTADTVSPETGLNDRNSAYQAEKPPYNVKALPLDSVDELKLIAGWDDEIHRVFSPYLTVYPFKPVASVSKSLINLNTVSPEVLSCLIPEARSSSAEKFWTTLTELKKKKTVVLKDVKETLKTLTSFEFQANDQAANPLNWFDRRTMVLRVEVEAGTGDQTKKLTVVLRKIMPKETENSRDKQTTKRSYQILYYRLL
ncbi:MAG: general secretion pathway protein GspK [Oligoflexales bacterium]|nr:general secretion pathway protein GspK [Oligoflexales bacterium]